MKRLWNNWFYRRVTMAVVGFTAVAVAVLMLIGGLT